MLAKLGQRNGSAGAQGFGALGAQELYRATSLLLAGAQGLCLGGLVGPGSARFCIVGVR